MPDALTVAVERGRAALAALNRPEILVASTESVVVRNSPFTAAWVLSAAAGAPRALPREIGDPNARYLHDSRNAGGLWSFLDEEGPALPGHADSTFCSLAALTLWGWPAEGGVGNERDRDTLLARCGSGGLFSHSLNAEPRPGEDPPDVAVNVNALWLGALTGWRLAEPQAFVTEFVRRNGLNCRLSSHHYRSPFVFAYFLSRWLARAAAADGDLRELSARVLWDCLWRRDQAAANALEGALALVCRLDLGPGSGAPDWREGLEGMARSLVVQQSPLGLWPALPFAFDPQGRAWGAIQITTAVCLEALDKYHTARDSLAERSGPDLSWRASQRADPLRRGLSSERTRGPERESLEETLAAVERHIPPALVAKAAYGRLRQIARLLPGRLAHGFGLETRLGERAARADFLLCVREEGREILARVPQHGGLRDGLAALPEWGRVRRLCEVLMDRSAAPAAVLEDLWLEFDVSGPPAPLPIPSVFFCLQELRVPEEPVQAGRIFALYEEVAGVVLETLSGQTLPADLRDRLGRCLAAIPAGAYPFALGVMLARRTEAVRLCVKDIRHDQIPDYLAAVGWAGPWESLASLLTGLAGLPDRTVLDLDVGSRMVLPKLGLECSFRDHRPPAQEPRWAALMEHLVTGGQCLRAKGDALLAWPGKLHCTEALADGTLVESYFSKLLGHVKVGLLPDGALEAKGYFGVWRTVERGRWRAAVPSA